jgi:hypothetical protein
VNRIENTVKEKDWTKKGTRKGRESRRNRRGRK